MNDRSSEFAPDPGRRTRPGRLASAAFGFLVVAGLLIVVSAVLS